MKKSLLLTLVLGLLLVAGCNAKEEVKKDNPNTTEISSEKSREPKSVEFTAKGTYKVGEDIEQGDYYVVLTKLEHDENDTSNLTEVDVNISDANDKYIDTVYFSSVGNKERVKLEKGMSFKVIDNGIEFKDFTLSFLNNTDFKKYESENQSTANNSNESTINNKSVETKPSKTVDDSQNVKVTDLLADYDSFIQKIKTTSEKASSMSEIESMNAVTDLIQEQTNLTSKLDNLKSQELTDDENTQLMNKSVDMLQEYTVLMNKLQKQ